MKILDSVQFGKELKKRRKKLGYTQSYLAEVTGISASFISELENGKATAEIGKAIYLANMLGLNLLIEEREE
jgi:y4mF family transcriptional regulator